MPYNKKMNRIRVIISTFGPLHLIKSAEFLNRLVDVRVIQGWIPSWWNKWVLCIASYILHRNIFKTIKKRTPEILKGRNVGIALPDFLFWGARLFRILPWFKYQVWAASLYGRLQQRYLRDADIFHVRSGSGGSGAIEKARSKGMKIVVDHSIAHANFMDKVLRYEYEKNGVFFDLGMDNPFWKNILDECKKADIILVNSHFVKDTFIENGFNSDMIKVVYLGVRKDFSFLKKDYNIKDEVLRILFTGGFGFRKGAEYILRALCKLDEMNVSYEMTVVGDYSGAIPLIKQYKPKFLNLVNTVPQDELKSYLANSDVYLFPSLCEGCASSGMEALAAGLPVIATIESGLPITDGINGMIVESKNIDSIVESLLYIRENSKQREEFGRNAANLIAEQYTWDKYAEEVYLLYLQLLNN